MSFPNVQSYVRQGNLAMGVEDAMDPARADVFMDLLGKDAYPVVLENLEQHCVQNLVHQNDRVPVTADASGRETVFVTKIGQGKTVLPA